MLNAIICGKKYGSGLAGIDLREEFSGSEDILTATIFERLFYLDDPRAIGILLSEQIWTLSSPYRPFVIQAILFWEKLSFAGRGIEPDCVIIFDDLILVVEAKRWDYRDQQEPSQLAKEYCAAIQAYPNKKIALLAIGGMVNDRIETKKRLEEQIRVEIIKSNICDKNLNFSSTSWANFFSVITKELSDTSAGRRILNDIQHCFNLHGISSDPPAWLIDLTRKEWEFVRNICQSIPKCLKPKNLPVDISKAEENAIFNFSICTSPDIFWRP